MSTTPHVLYLKDENNQLNSSKEEEVWCSEKRIENDLPGAKE
jgi:hypothetical protein